MITEFIRCGNLRNPRVLRALLRLATLGCVLAGCSALELQDRWVYSCPDGSRFDVRFSGDGESAELSAAGPPGAAKDRRTETFHLKREVSASGARYSDGTTVLWTKGIMAIIEIDSEVVHRDCQGDGDLASRTG